MGERVPPRVLLIDDDPVIIRLLEVNFRLEGFDVRAASRGEEALQEASANRPDVVVLDVMMPGIDGWEVARRFRDHPSLADIPIVFLSARAQEEDLARGRDLDVREFVTKPFDPSHLVEVVRRHVETHRRPS